MADLGRVLTEQRECVEYLNGDGPDRAGAIAGLNDWVAEECAIRGEYGEFLRSKTVTAPSTGVDVPESALGEYLFDFQRAIVRWALRRGRAALFEDCGLGKTIQQLEWARIVAAHTDKPVLILTPLAVSEQTEREAGKFGIGARIVESAEQVGPGINITNYEKLHHFNAAPLGGLVLDESSILKAFDGHYRKALTEFAADIPFRLACTATPAPNDHMELGNHAEFLSVMKAVEMYAMFFTHDGGETSKWRLKRHGVAAFWRWVCSWAVAVRSPADLGFDASRFELPRLHYHQHIVKTDYVPEGFLFAPEAQSLMERRSARAGSLNERVAATAALANDSTEPWLVWCNLNAESAALSKAIPDAVEVKGDDSREHKRDALLGFPEGKFRVLVSKPTLAGFGMNYQHCPNVAFVGLSDSFEQFYQAIRRCWRFGQTREVHCHVIVSEQEGAVVRNIQRKEQQAEEMMKGMVNEMRDTMRAEVLGQTRVAEQPESKRVSTDQWTAVLGDSCEEIKLLASGSIDYSVFSPPFASLYTYTDSPRDMGNSRNHAEFYQHFGFLIGELFRVLRPGRLLSFHCMNLPSSKERDGVIGLKDFRGEMIRAFQQAGFIYHSEVCIWKDPVTAMQRTKAIGLLYKQLRKDSVMSRQGIPDYLVTMRKPGENTSPVTKTHESFPVGLWQRYASPVWMDINPSKTLQYRSARAEEDERHICPLQLEVIERAIELWTNQNDLVLSPFMGIGSEGYIAIKQGRRFTGIELKRSYFDQAVLNLAGAGKVNLGLFDKMEEEDEGLISRDV